MARDLARQLPAGTIVAVCFFVAALEGYDIQAFGVAAPQMAPRLGLGPSELGVAGSAAMVGLVIGAVLGGWLADRVGRRPVLAAAVGVFGAFSLATAMVGDYQTLLLARLATGLGFGAALPNLIAIATEISPPGRRAATATMMFCGMPAGGAAVAFLAQAGGGAMDWRTLFTIGGVLPLAIAPAILFLLPETRPRPDPGADLSLARALFAGGRAVPTLLLWMVFVLTLLVLYLMLNWLPTLVVAKGLAPADGFAAAMSFNLTSIAGAVLAGLVVDRLGFRWPLAAMFAALAAVMLALGRADGLAAILILSGLCGALVIGANYILYALSPLLYPEAVRAAGAGAAVAVGRLGSIAGPLVAGELRAAGYTPGQVFEATVPAVLAAGLMVAVLTSLRAGGAAAPARAAEAGE
jgi:AAHS family 3-hydroxyphenylpropionic acid transporter